MLDALVRIAGTLIGVVCHEHVGPVRVWSPEDHAFAGSIGDYVAMAWEIDRRRRLEGRMRYLELHDPHTDLPNRDHLLEVVHAALKPMHGDDTGLVAIHLHIDASTHEGDADHRLLAQVADCLRGELGETATLARVRGDAFAVLPHRHLHETEALNLAERCIELIEQASTQIFLGLVEEVAYFALDLSDHDPAPSLSHGEFLDLRQVGPRMAAFDGGILAYARAMATWHRRHRFCGICGAPTESRDGGHVRQ
jgi:GGDEF domain-containing protein